MKREGKALSFIQQMFIDCVSELVTALGSQAKSLNKPDEISALMGFTVQLQELYNEQNIVNK